MLNSNCAINFMNHQKHDTKYVQILDRTACIQNTHMSLEAVQYWSPHWQ